MRATLAIAPLACLLLGGFAAAQTHLERFERQLERIRRDTRLRVSPEVPLQQRAYFDYGAYLAVNFLSLDDPQLRNRVLRQYDFAAWGRLNLDGAHDILLRGRAFYRDFNDGDAFDSNVNGWDGRVERAYYRFDLARHLAASQGRQISGDFAVKVGRDLVWWANGLTLSQELDGAVIDLEYGPAALELLAGITPLDTVDFDSSRPNFAGHTKRGFFGGMFSVRSSTHRPFVYVLTQRDYNDTQASVDITDDSAGDIPTRWDYNSLYIGVGSTGALTDRLAYGVELVYEGGNTLSNSFAVDSGGAISAVPQQRDDIQAWALDVQIDYLLEDQHRTRVSGELILASGDSDRLTTSNTFGGNQPGTTDRAFNAFGLLNTGLAFAPNVSNLIAVRGGVSTFPLKRLQIGTDLFFFAKLDSNAPIDESTTDDQFLGVEPDLYLNWQIASDVTLALRYGAFIPGDAIVADDKIRQFLYAGVTFAF